MRQRIPLVSVQNREGIYRHVSMMFDISKELHTSIKIQLFLCVRIICIETCVQRSEYDFCNYVRKKSMYDVPFFCACEEVLRRSCVLGKEGC